MPFSRSRPRSAKYDHAHAKLRAQHMQSLAERGVGRCAEVVCVKPSRRITAAMGSDLHLCHDRATGQVLGLGHATCNRREAAKYARSKQGKRPTRPTRTDYEIHLDWG